MDFLFTDEQLELRATVRAFLAEKSAEESVRRLMATETGYDPGVWKQLSEQLGLTGLAVPEEYEGAGVRGLALRAVPDRPGGRPAPRAVLADRPRGPAGRGDRPITNMLGEGEFCEVFFTGARTRADLIVGSPGDGWKVAMAALGSERSCCPGPRPSTAAAARSSGTSSANAF